MKTKRICKSTVSLILAVMMIVSMFTVGIVNASAAETDVAETGADKTWVYFTRPSGWTNEPKIYYWGGATPATWPGTKMTWVINNNNNTSIWKAEIPADSTKIIFNNAESPQTEDIVLANYNHVSGLGYSLNSTANSNGKYSVSGTYDTYVVPDDSGETPVYHLVGDTITPGNFETTTYTFHSCFRHL